MMTAQRLALLFWLIPGIGFGAGLEAFEPDRIVPYKEAGEATLQMHVFVPPGHAASDRRAAIVFFFGGGWIEGSPRQFYPHCDYLASRGMVAMAAEYRVESRNGTSPRESVMDAKSALRWMRSHAANLGVDPTRIVAGGGSAGGHLAAAAALTEGFNEKDDDLAVSTLPAALVLFNPVFDNGPGGYGHERVKAYWESISPLHNLSAEAPPTIIFLGTADDLVPVSTAEDYQRRMEAHGRTCELHLFEGQPHGFFNYRNTAIYRDTVRRMDRFLVGLGLLAP